VEPQTPPGPRPPAKQEPPKTETVWISPRLREKLDEESDAPRQGGTPLVGLVLAVLVIGGGIGLFSAMRSGAAREKAEAAHREQLAAEAAAAESVANAARLDSMRAARADTSTRPGSATSKPASSAHGPSASAGASSAPKGGAETGGAPAAAPAPVEKGPFGLDVGTFLVEDRANSEQSRLSTSTGLAGKVVTMNEDGADVYHVVLGSFPTRAAAERKAGSLVTKGMVNQARTVPLAP
jgi:cell division septation protein DedD